MSHLPIPRLMETVKVKSVSLNVYYMVLKNIFRKKSWELWKYFFCFFYNSFSLHVLYLENFLRIYLNLVSPINELIIENYLSENNSVVKNVANVKKVKEKITKRVFDWVVDVGKNIMIYLNVVLENIIFEHIFSPLNLTLIIAVII